MYDVDNADYLVNRRPEDKVVIYKFQNCFVMYCVMSEVIKSACFYFDFNNFVLKNSDTLCIIFVIHLIFGVSSGRR